MATEGKGETATPATIPLHRQVRYKQLNFR